MKPAIQLFKRINELFGGWDNWRGGGVTRKQLRDSWRISCGTGRYDREAKNGLESKRVPAVLRFEIICDSSAEISRYSIGLHYTDDSGLGLLFHHDPDTASWPDHPLHHIHVEANGQTVGESLREIRLPFGETEALRILEYLIGLCTPSEVAGVDDLPTPSCTKTGSR